MAQRHERVWFRDGDRLRSALLRVTGDSDLFLTGVEVNVDGDEVEPPGFSQRTRVIDKTLVERRKRYVWDLKYGELVPE